MKVNRLDIGQLAMLPMQAPISIDAVSSEQVLSALHRRGWCLLRGYDVDITRFGQLVSRFCHRLTYDPAREFSDKHSQKVDAGTAAIGLHIENGNTPFPPDIIAFYSKKSARIGSETTLCDGHDIYQTMSDTLKSKFNQTITVKRKLPQTLWKRYVANEHPTIQRADEVTVEHLQQMLQATPMHRATLCDDTSIDYELDISPVITSRFSELPAFANAILGPSYNYETPRYCFADGSVLNEALTQELAELAEQSTHEISWQDGDVVLIDNKRIMHGRREIKDAENRELHIAMGIIHD